MRTNLTDEEIKQYMNFDDVLKGHEAQRRAANRWIRNVTIAVAVGAVAVLIYSLVPNDAPTSLPVEPKKSMAATDSLVQSSQKEERAKDPTPKKSTPVEKKPTTKEPLAIRENKTTVEAEKPAAANSSAVQYQQAEPLKGYPDLYDYFARELQYPEGALKDSIQGVVSVSFIINTAGRPEQINIQNSLGTLFDAEAIRIIEHMPDWKPAQLNGKRVPAKVAVPLTFRIVKTEPH